MGVVCRVIAGKQVRCAGRRADCNDTWRISVAKSMVSGAQVSSGDSRNLDVLPINLDTVVVDNSASPAAAAAAATAAAAAAATFCDDAGAGICLSRTA